LIPSLDPPRLEHPEPSVFGLRGAASLRLFRLVSEILHAAEAGAFHPRVGWHCQARCWEWGL